MNSLPNSTIINKTIPKSVFYSKMNLGTSVKNEFTNLIDKIIWKNKLSEDTIGISSTSDVEEIHIFEITLKNKIIPINAIKLIFKSISYPVLINLKNKEDFCYVIAIYDEKKFKNIFLSEWNEIINFNFLGLNLRNVYEKIVKLIIKEYNNDERINIIIERNKKIGLLEKEIEQLKNRIKVQKQFNKKIELNKSLNNKINELEVIKNG